MYCYIDIETVANDRAREFYENYWEPGGNCTKPETIAKKKQEQIETLEGAGLHWWTGKVACICAEAVGDVFESCKDDEKSLLTNFFTWARTRESEYAEPMMYVGKNSDEFDVPFLIGRGMVNRLVMPYYFSGAYWKHDIADIDIIFGRGKNGQHGKLDYYCFGLGLSKKLHHGSEVQGMWNDRRFEEILEYCRDDRNKIRDIMEIWRECSE